ncbi:hypothetical protein Bxe_A0160 [Paraburkholderia xenovorans LB400]|uniref:Transmembrane protein n=1 Tax=Paraburkholderia xenovorans (strain LB400) TaxID=266265 RepID=Q13T18_PARXL|nr:hypothetical protein Bxe_A0160 [Paraburkholderia xenovorans LB400]
MLCLPLVLVRVIVVYLPAARWVEKKGYCGLSLVFGFWFLFWFCCLGFGLFLICLWSISVAPVRGGTYFLCRGKESRQRKPLYTAST